MERSAQGHVDVRAAPGCRRNRNSACGSRSSAARSRRAPAARPAGGRGSSGAWAVSTRESSPGPSPPLACSRASNTRAEMLRIKMRHRDDQRARPGEVLPILVGAQRELEDDHRQIRHRSVQVGAPELIVERGEQQRRGLAADARDRQQKPGDDAAARRRVQDARAWCATDRRRARRRNPSFRTAPDSACPPWFASVIGMARTASDRAPAIAEKCPMRTTTIS